MNHIMKFAAVALLALIACSNDDTIVLYQVSDPQFGFYAKNADFVYETGTFTKAVEAINATSPDAVIYTGDIVHDHKDSLQWEGFLGIASTINPEIRQLSLPGNHDVHGKEGRVDLTYWEKYIGADRLSEKIGNVRLIGIDSNLYKYVEGSEADLEQKAWLEGELAKGKKGEMTLVLAHHPFFLKSADEPEEYFNIKPETRSYYTDLFRKAGVKAVICGHKHDNYVTADGEIPYVTTSATGKPLGAAPSGVRVFVCEKGNLYHAYFALDEIPGSRAELIDAVKKTAETGQDSAAVRN